ncbi:MAG: tRNA (adenosine(37)-N6)-threonylcarbamoyltransferase complex dimerization subunit type 1 TsaB [Deltaproteobacteria bacterium]|nr:tRNA (adenosine(37)-N6)-threonylcarbamoyltransferase complex dimerization subunit type 1 TsaB [Deltaproteobacteria bacterium]
MIDDFYAFYDFYGFNDLLFTARSALSLSKGSLLTKGYAPIMKILAIDTSTPVGSIAIVEGALLKAQHILNISATHNQRLFDGLAVSLGPGSFTGLRIGLSVVKGLAWATGKPLAGVPTLDALAANVPLAPYPIYPVLDARKGEIYTALYRMDDEQVPARLSPYMAIKPEKLVDLISEKTLLVGDALLRYGDYLTGKLGDRLHLVPPHLNVVHASSVAWLAWHKLRRGIHEDISSCTPLYVRPSEAELNRISE